MPLKTAILSAAQSGFYVALPGFRGALPAPLLRNVLRTPLQCLPCFFMLQVGIGTQKSLGNPIKCMALQKKKVSRHKRGRCWRGGRKPVPAGVRSATRGMEPKGGTPQVPHKGHVLQQRSFGGKKPSAAKKKKKFTLNSAIFLCKALQTFEKFTKLCKLYMA